MQFYSFLIFAFVEMNFRFPVLRICKKKCKKMLSQVKFFRDDRNFIAKYRPTYLNMVYGSSKSTTFL